jgi:sterol desaturase/sphingolipid hydroxylase (fatty acid hydroxylase superfamily)
MMSETAIRLSVFLTLFAVFSLAEAIWPKRPRALSRSSRWFTNWALSVLNTVTLRVMALVLPVMAVGAALDAASNGWGVLNQLTWPFWITVVIAILVLDFAIWAQHLLTHKIPILWRLHRVHHADRDMDVSTAIRFHPLEIAFSMMIKIGVIYLLGPPAIAVIVFEILLNATALFNHANLALPRALDNIIRRVIVTPDMHRIHHSVHRHEHDSNYGFSLSIWDRLFGTYRADPDKGQQHMITGLQWQDRRPAKLGWSLSLPFRRK